MEAGELLGGGRRVQAALSEALGGRGLDRHLHPACKLAPALNNTLNSSPLAPQAALSEALGGRGLDRHLDSDEAVVLGASLFAANLSTSFRLRRFGFADLTMYGVQMTVDEVHQAQTLDAGAEGSGSGSGPDVRNLLPAMKKLPIKRIVHFNNLTSDPIRVSLAYNTSAPNGLPPGVDEAELGAFEITGVDGAIRRYNSSGTVNLRFEADYGGVLKLDKAEAVVEYEVMEEKIVQVKANETNLTVGGEEEEGAGGKGKEEAAEAKKEETDGEKEEEAEEGKAEEAKEGDREEESAGEKNVTAAEGKEEGGNVTAAGGKNATTVKRIMVAKKKVAKVKI